MRATASSGYQPWRRSRAAMVEQPVERRTLAAVSRSVDMTPEPTPAWIRPASSPRLTSLLRCARFSINHCPRASAKRWHGGPRAGGKLVMP